MQNLSYLVIMVISEILICLVALLIRKKDSSKSQIKNFFNLILLCISIWTLSLIFQILLQNTTVSPVLFEGFASFGACFVGVFILFLGLAFSRTKIEFRKSYLLLFVIPLITTFLMFTNETHHLMYETYSIDINKTVFGPYMTIHSIYTYATIFVGLLYLLVYSIRNLGFFSKQSLLIILGVLIPIVVNILGYMNIIAITVYMTPISFAAAILLFALAIFKFKFLSVAPIALQRVVDRMSDAYIVLNEENRIIDFNETLLKTSKLKSDFIRNKEIFELIGLIENLPIDEEKFKNALKKSKTTTNTISFEKYFEALDKYYNIEISSIMNKNTFLGTLILFKDITQHTLDMKTIRDNQDLLVEKERLAGLGQMIGGIAHNLKTPIMSISGASKGLMDLIDEYDSSIEDPTVNFDDHHEIAKEMREWVEKIKSYNSYMSDVITAVKGQAVALSENSSATFTVGEMLKYVDILMKHELKNALINLKISVNLETDLELTGNVNSLVQVINNIVSNAIQAYGGKKNEDVIMNISKEDNKLIIAIQDFACGMSKEVQDNLFKKMVTTKGKNGTGLGLFMSYSNIKAHFGGNISFESKEGVGTTFYITIPIR